MGHGDGLDEVNHNNFEYNAVSYKFRIPDTPNTSVNLRPQARILNKMFLHTVIPRTDSYEKMYDNNYAALYAIYSRKMINWGKVILDDIKSFNI